MVYLLVSTKLVHTRDNNMLGTCQACTKKALYPIKNFIGLSNMYDVKKKIQTKFKLKVVKMFKMKYSQMKDLQTECVWNNCEDLVYSITCSSGLIAVVKFMVFNDGYMYFIRNNIYPLSFITIAFFSCCLPTEHQGVHKNLFRNVGAFQDRIGIWKIPIGNFWFLWRGEDRTTRRK